MCVYVVQYHIQNTNVLFVSLEMLYWNLWLLFDDKKYIQNEDEEQSQKEKKRAWFINKGSWKVLLYATKLAKRMHKLIYIHSGIHSSITMVRQAGAEVLFMKHISQFLSHSATRFFLLLDLSGLAVDRDVRGDWLFYRFSSDTKIKIDSTRIFLSIKQITVSLLYNFVSKYTHSQDLEIAFQVVFKKCRYWKGVDPNMNWLILELNTQLLKGTLVNDNNHLGRKRKSVWTERSFLKTWRELL